MKKMAVLAVRAAAIVLAPLVCFAQSPIVINELMYNPGEGGDSGEYVELYNAGYGPVDLSNWRFSVGIDFTFPEGTVLDEADYLVVCKNQDYIRTICSINNVVGDYSNTLSNVGERVRLVNSVGMTMDEVWYEDKNPWPASADGLGYSLELRNPSLDNTLASSWFGSITLSGTPGKANSIFSDPGAELVSLIKRGDEWQFFRGRTEPPGPAGEWKKLGYDASAWEKGPSGFGVGDNDDATVLSDLPGNYFSVYIRKEFTIDNLSAVGNLRLTIDYDDGFVAYINGYEPVRRGLGEPGTAVSHTTPASSHEAGTPESFDLGSLPGTLRAGANVIAIECHNESLTNGDLSLIPVLDVDFSCPVILINEFQCEPEGWVELYNPSSSSVPIGGYFLTDDPGDLTKFRIPDSTVLQGKGLAVFSKGQLGFPMPAAGGGIWLVGPDQTTVIDCFTFGQQYSGMSYGRFPDGGDNWYFLLTPTKGQPNLAVFRDDVVINEIMYHPVGGSEEEFIELYNKGSERVELAGWELRGAVRFAFPQGAFIDAGSYLVVAGSVSAVSAKYGISGVLGDFSGNLRNYGEDIVLLDSLGNPADIVRYADDPPWPLEADGLGPSLELTHPELDNGFGQMWAASDAVSAPQGTPGAPNSTLGRPIPPAIVQTRHSPAVPKSTDTVTITTRVIDDGAIGDVSLFFRKDGQTLFSIVTMTAHGSGSPKDQVYEAQLAAQAAATKIEFYIEAQDNDSNVSRFPSDAPARTCLYLVNDATEPADLPLYRALMTNANYTELRTRDVDSNVFLDATFICGEEIRYNVGLRYRGYGSRGVGEPNISYRVQFNNGEPFGKVRKLNLNGQRPSSQAVGWDMMRRVGMPYSETKLVNLKLNDSFWGVRIQVESVDQDYLRRVFPEDSSGNLYRGEGHQDRTGKPYGADFLYRGEDPDAYAPYQKQTNEVENDFTDVIHLCDVFTNTPDDQFEQAIGELLNVEEWITYFAVNSCLNNREGAIYLDAGDDYFIYHYPYDGKWYLIPWDLDTILDDPTETIFRQTLPMIVRFLSAPSFRLMYYRKLQHLLDYEFSERQMFAAIDSLKGKFADATLQGYKDVVTGRIADIRSQIVTELTIEPPSLGVVYIRPGDEWMFFRGKVAPSNPYDYWKSLDFDDRGWEKGPSGFGFGDNDDATELTDMQNYYLTVYIRKEFKVPSVADVGTLQLIVDYDDGFIAWLNGTKVAWGNMPDDPPDAPVYFDTPAKNTNHEAGTPETFDITKYIYLLRTDKNVLAMEGHNGSKGSSDVSLIPTLRSTTQVVQSAGSWIVRHADLTLSGTAPVALTDTVLVNGSPANYDLGRGTWSYQISLSPGLNEVSVSAFARGVVIDTKTAKIVYIPPDHALSGQLSGSTTWTKEPSPYLVSQTVVVPLGATLTIEPGTEVMLANGQSLVVMGTLLANGTEAEPIVFTRYADGEKWGSLVFEDSVGSKLSHCVVEYSSSAGSYDGKDYVWAVAVVGSQLDVDGCVFRKLPDESPAAQGDAIEFSAGSSGEVTNSRFLSIGSGVRTDRSYVVVENCVFSDIRGSGNDPVDVNGLSSPMPVVKNNLFTGSQDDGIDMDNCAPLVTGNLIYSIVGKGISVGSASSPRMENNAVAWNGTGIAVMDGSTPLIINNTIVNNQVGIHGYEKTAGRGGGNATVVNCILWGNGTEVVLDTLSSASVSYSDVEGASVWPGEGNINADPRFADGANKDFRLTKLSPCVDAGTATDAPAEDLLGNPRPRAGGFDMGAYESPYWLFVDTDTDGAADGWEVYYFGSLARNADGDFDNDGMNDLTEYDLGADPTNSDTDGDGMPDGWEWSHGLSPVSPVGADGPDADRDGDGLTNYQEYVAGSDPSDANSTFGVAEVTPSGDTVGLRWHALAGRGYNILRSSDMVSWTEAATLDPASEREAEWFDSTSNGAPRLFYKVEVFLP